VQRGPRGFTLLELVIAMTVLSLVTLALYGVVSLGASSAGAGERRAEQARRFRVATQVMVRQLRSAAPMYVSRDKDEQAEPYFVGEADSVEFVTSAPQGPYAAGLALVHYWLEDGKLMMSEVPYFLAYDKDGLRKDAEALTLQTALLYDVKDVVFEYQRSDYESEQWDDKWDAADDDTMPAGVHVTVTPEKPDGPALDYQIPLLVGVFNEVTGEEDYHLREGHAPNFSLSELGAGVADSGANGATGRKGRSAKQSKKDTSGDQGTTDTVDDGDFGDDGDEP
jgi:general secretion pathway protein J